MTRPLCEQELYRRSLAIIVAVVALASASCGSPAGASSAPPAPVNVDSVRAAFQNSTMDNAHFYMHGTLFKGRTYYPITGNGIYQMRPVEGLAINVYLQTFSTKGTVTLREVSINGQLYTKTGAGKWTSQPTSITPSALTSYVGEEIMDGKAVWHARSEAGRTIYDLWIRESDAYILRIKYGGISGTFTMDFNTYNRSQPLITPKN